MNINEHGNCAHCGGPFQRVSTYVEDVILEEDGEVYDVTDFDRDKVVRPPFCRSCGRAADGPGPEENL